MATARDSVELQLKLERERQFKRGVDSAARSVDNLGDQAKQASRHMRGLNAASKKTIVGTGAITLNFRNASFALGTFLLAAKSATPIALSLAEAVGTVGAAGGAAGVTGFLALAQGAGVAQLALGDLTDALGGNEAALKRLGPEAQNLFFIINRGRMQLKATAQEGMFPGLEKGITSASKNLPVLNQIVNKTARALGGMAASAGKTLGSKAFGGDIADIGSSNVAILKNLGHAGGSLAMALKDIVHEAGPLTRWLSAQVKSGASLIEAWIGDKRKSGELRQFFDDAKQDIKLIASIGGNLAGGIINLFGHDDVDGTKTLQNLDDLSKRFKDWTASIQGGDLSAAIQEQIKKGLGTFAEFVAQHIGEAGALGFKTFWDAFWSAPIGGKAITAAFLATRLGLTKGVVSGLSTWLGTKLALRTSKKDRIRTGLNNSLGRLEKDQGMLGGSFNRPMYVYVTNNGPGGTRNTPGAPGTPGGSGGRTSKTPPKKPTSKLGRLLQLGKRGATSGIAKTIGGTALTLGLYELGGDLLALGGSAAAGGLGMLGVAGTAGAAGALAVPAGLAAWAMHAASRRRAAGATPGGDRIAASRQNGGATRNIYLDDMGFPTSRSKATRVIPKGGTEDQKIVVENTVNVKLPDGPSYRSTNRTVAKRHARRKVRTSVITADPFAFGRNPFG